MFFCWGGVFYGFSIRDLESFLAVINFVCFFFFFFFGGGVFLLWGVSKGSCL